MDHEYAEDDAGQGEEEPQRGAHPTSPAGETLTTVRVTNVPADVREREFNGWFLFAMGFEEAVLFPRGGESQMGWARFSTEEDAYNAVSWLHGRALTEKQGPPCVLYAEMAKSNLRGTSNSAKRGRLASQPRSVPPPVHIARQMPRELAVARLALQAGNGITNTTVSTLFSWGCSNCSEQEIGEFFQEHFVGFHKLSMGKNGTCFVKFDTPDQANEALQSLESNFLAFPSNPTRRVQAELAKSDINRGGNAGGGVLVPPPSFASSGRPPSQPSSWAPLVGTPEGPRGVAPCDTMFIGGLAEETPEEELASILEGLEGFLGLKVALSGRSRPMAWARFISPEACNNAILFLNGTALPSAPERAIGCEFAKSSLDSFSRRA